VVADSEKWISSWHEKQGHSMSTVGIVVPAYNEADSLVASLSELWECLSRQPGRYRWSLLIVNDGSTDQTGNLAEKFAAGKSNVRVVHHETNRGLSEALRTAFGCLNDDWIVTLDADLSYEPSHIARMLEAAEQTGAAIVLASPYMPGGKVSNVPWVRHALSRLANVYLAGRLRGRLHTFTSVMRVYRRDALTLPVSGDISFQMLVEALRRGAKIVEVPAHLHWRSRFRRTSPARITRRIGEILCFARQLSNA
jgi:glycosyltransferase involved in cell wall biosynthesis